jgi:hypothetical protein
MAENHFDVRRLLTIHRYVNGAESGLAVAAICAEAYAEIVRLRRILKALEKK